MLPSDFKSFSDIFSVFSVEFCERATPMASPPLGPRSLSLIDRLSSVLFLTKRAAMHTAPQIPKLFLRMLVSSTPKSRCLRLVFIIRSSKKSSIPYPEIMLEAKFNEVIFELALAKIFFTECIPQSVMLLSARFSFSTTLRVSIEFDNAIIALMPKRSDQRFKAVEFLTLRFKRSSLKSLAFSTLVDSPLSWHFALKISI